MGTKRQRGGKKVDLEQARYSARYFGAEAVANDVGLDEYRDDIALRYGFESWDAMPADLRSDALKHYTLGRQAERKGGTL